MTEASHAKLYAALARASAAAQAVAKNATNSFHRYKYASAESLIEEARGALASAELAVLPMLKEVVPSQIVQGGSTLLARYRLVHSSGECIELSSSTEVMPEKGRPQDKAEAAASTLNLGYFLRDLLLLPREDAETSVDQRDDRSKGQSPQVGSPVSTSTPNVVVVPIPVDSFLSQIEAARVARDLPALMAVGKAATAAGVTKQVMEPYKIAFDELKKVANGGAA
jgi:hypothetical protein